MPLSVSVREAVSAAEIARELSLASKESLGRIGSVKTLRKGELLFWDKDQVDFVYIVASGMVSLYKMSSQGEKKVIFVLGKGKAINEVILHDLPASINCEAFEFCEILCLPKQELLSLMEQDFALTKAIFDSMAMKVRRLYRQMKNTSNSVRLDKRLAAKLWKMAEDHGIPSEDGVVIDLDLSITYLADMMGSKRETVSRQLKVLSEKGLVNIKGSRFIIPELTALSRYFKHE